MSTTMYRATSCSLQLFSEVRTRTSIKVVLVRGRTETPRSDSNLGEKEKFSIMEIDGTSPCVINRLKIVLDCESSIFSIKKPKA